MFRNRSRVGHILMASIVLVSAVVGLGSPAEAQTPDSEINRCLGVDPPAAALASPHAAAVYRLYCAYFLRPPKLDGLRYWTSRAKATSLASVANAFAASPEFKNRYGTVGNSRFVSLVFVNVLDRLPADSGRIYWSNRLASGMSRGSLMINFSDSSEFKRRTSTTQVISTGGVYYVNCDAARAAGVAPIYRGQPGYALHLDRDRDGIACEWSR